MRRWLIVLFMISALVLGACGGNDGNDSGNGNDDGGSNNGSSDGDAQPTRFRNPTLPPVIEATASFTPQPTQTATTPPTLANDVADDTAIRGDSELCTSFTPDTVRNQPSESVQAGQTVTIYWFGIQADNISYLVQLYDNNARAIFAEEVVALEFTFEESFFANAVGHAFYWQVIPYQNGAPMEVCVALDGEIFVNAGQ